MTTYLRSKKKFFAALDQLDDSENQDEEREDAYGVFVTPAAKANNIIPKSVTSPPGDVLPVPANSGSRSPCDIQSKRDDHKPDATCPPVTEIMPVTRTRGPPEKRRKTNNTKIVPDEDQIFKGLIFFFFPNNDVSPFRRLRIQRAQEYGARWSRNWAHDVTHVISDKGLRSSDLLTYLKLESLPDTIVLVNESYPSECIQFRSVLNPSQLRFRVDEILTAEVDKSLAAAQPSLPDSLPLKKSRREKDQSPEKDPSSIGEVTHTFPEDGLSTIPKAASGSTPDAEAASSIHEAATHGEGSRGSRERDALDDMIDEAKATSHLVTAPPLDPLESAAGTFDADGSDIDTSSSEDESNRKQRKAAPREHKGKSDWTKGFACMQEFDPSKNLDNPNSRTIEVLQQMLEYYVKTSDQWRVIAYRKAINALRQQPKKITTRAQARLIPGIGERLANKVEEIVLTNRLRRLDNTTDTPEDLIIQEFLGVYGAGLLQASKWVAQGYRSLKDLLEKAPLSRPQRIGVERYNDFAQRIPRKEVEAHGAIVQKAVQGVDRDMQVIIGGSYRRGAVTCGDVDCLITKPGASLEQIRTIMLGLVVPKLFSSGILKASLAASSHNDGSKWHGASALPGTDLWRRIDLLFVPDAEIGAALIYFTGNDMFNRSMRLLARKKGMCLNQKGLFTDVLRRQQVKLNAGRLIEGRDERQIFALLGVPWRPPEHRIC
ncbi:DNA polymerase family X [Penicillium sp. DV-2018c]|nr:DNA polymerase family X [Penicillium sp. DV-2018c]KAJ5576642.1 DNA polymerase family X [Penicillium sp. DV-2018c]